MQAEDQSFLGLYNHLDLNMLRRISMVCLWTQLIQQCSLFHVRNAQLVGNSRIESRAQRGWHDRAKIVAPPENTIPDARDEIVG